MRQLVRQQEGIHRAIQRGNLIQAFLRSYAQPGIAVDQEAGAKLRAMNQDAASVEFLKTELETGITFADLALSAKHEDKLERTKANARKAYDTALRFMEKLKPEDAAELEVRLKHLVSKLRQLGESV